MLNETRIEKHLLSALALIGAIASIYYVGVWTNNHHEFKMRCLEANGAYLSGSGTCRIARDPSPESKDAKSH